MLTVLFTELFTDLFPELFTDLIPDLSPQNGQLLCYQNVRTLRNYLRPGFALRFLLSELCGCMNKSAEPDTFAGRCSVSEYNFTAELNSRMCACMYFMVCGVCEYIFI